MTSISAQLDCIYFSCRTFMVKLHPYGMKPPVNKLDSLPVFTLGTP